MSNNPLFDITLIITKKINVTIIVSNFVRESKPGLRGNEVIESGFGVVRVKGYGLQIRQVVKYDQCRGTK